PPEPMRLIPLDDAQRPVELFEDARRLDVGARGDDCYLSAANRSMVGHQALLRRAHCVAPPAHGRPPVGAALGGGRLLLQPTRRPRHPYRIPGYKRFTAPKKTGSNTYLKSCHATTSPS